MIAAIHVHVFSNYARNAVRGGVTAANIDVFTSGAADTVRSGICAS
jgi:hypothetical protein